MLFFFSLLCAGSASTNGETHGISVIFTDELSNSVMYSPTRLSPTHAHTAPPTRGAGKRGSINFAGNNSNGNNNTTGKIV
jgi:hypothetical protein